MQLGPLTSVTLSCPRFGSGFQKQASHVVYPFMEVFEILPSTVVLAYLPQSSKPNPQKGSWHQNSPPYFHQSSCGRISWVFILSVYFSSSL